MTILTSNQLTAQQLADLRGLVAACKTADDSVPNLYFYILELPRTLPASALCYENNQLIGFLSIYFFYEDAVEAALLIHPAHRRQSVAKRLLEQMRLLLEINHTHKLIFTTAAGKNGHWLEQKGFRYDHSEYHMVRDDLNPLLNHTPMASFRYAKPQDIPDLCAIDAACFTKKQPELPERFNSLLNDRSYKVIVLEVGQTVIGKAHIRWDERGASLSDISVLPYYQGRGYGASLIAHCVNIILSEGKQYISLDVETHNTRALELYKNLGFLIDNACDYWSIPVSRLLNADKLA